MQHQVSLEILDKVVENNERVTLEKVKKWLKGNALAISSIGIMLASFVTAIVALTKKGLTIAKDSFGNFSKAVKEIAKKVGPVIGPIVSLAGMGLSLLAKGANYLLKHFFTLFVPSVALLRVDT